VVARDEAHDALRGAVGLRQLGAAAGMVEIARERRVAAREANPHERSEPREQHSRDPMPEPGARGLRPVVQETRDDEFVIRTKLAQDARGLRRVTVVRAGGPEIADRLLDTMEYRTQNLHVPISVVEMKHAGPKTTVLKIRAPKNKSRSNRIGPYC